MNAQLMGMLIDCAIPILAGAYCTLLGFRWVGKKPGESEKYDAWYARFGRWFKFIGPLLVVITLVRLLLSLPGVIPKS